MTKEEIYDEHINPLMAKVIAICKEHKIAHVSSFSLDYDEGLACTTCLIGEESEPPESFEECVRILYGQRNGPPLNLTVRDGDGNVTEMTTIIP